MGPLSRDIADAAREAGLAADRISCVADAQEALDALQGTLAGGDVVLVKASHSTGLDNVVKGLVR